MMIATKMWKEFFVFAFNNKNHFCIRVDWVESDRHSHRPPNYVVCVCVMIKGPLLATKQTNRTNGIESNGMEGSKLNKNGSVNAITFSHIPNIF